MAVLLLMVITAVYTATLSFGFGLIFNTTRVFHLPFGSLYAAFLYVGYYLGTVIGNGLAGMIVALLLMPAFAFAVHAFLYEPLLRASHELLPPLVTAVGIFTIIQAILVLPNSSQPISLRGHLPDLGTTRLLGTSLRTIDVVGVVAEVVVVCVVIALLRRTSLGLFVRAVGDDSDLASVLGVTVGRARGVAMVIGTALSLVAALFWTWSAGVISPGVSLTAALSATVAAFLGGTSSFGGAILGGAVLGVAQVAAFRYLSGSWADVAVYGSLLLVILIRPQGLVGTALRRV